MSLTAFQQDHVERGREYQRAYYLRNRDKKIAYARAYHEAHRNGPARRRGRSVPKVEYEREYHRRVVAPTLAGRRLAALRIVSGKETPACVSCGITDPRILVINHINGGGNADRKHWSARDITAGIISGARKADDLDVRCHNCNILYEYERGARVACR